MFSIGGGYGCYDIFYEMFVYYFQIFQLISNFLCVDVDLFSIFCEDVKLVFIIG